MPTLQEILADVLKNEDGEADSSKIESILEQAKKEADALSNERNKALEGKRDELLEKLRKAKDNQIPEGFDMSDYETYLAEKDKIEEERKKAEEEKLIASQNWEKLKSDMNDNHTKALNELKESYEAQLKEAKGDLNSFMIENKALQAIEAEDGNTFLLLPHIKPQLETVKTDSGYEIIVKNPDKSQRMNAETGEPFGLKDLVAEMKSDTKFSGAFPTSNRGSGQEASAGGGEASSQNNPFKKGSSYNVTEQAKLIKTNPTLAAALKKAAG